MVRRLSQASTPCVHSCASDDTADPNAPLSPKHLEVLARAVGRLEHARLAKHLSEFAGRPVGKALMSVPEPLKSRLDQAAEKAILRCLDVAVKSLKPTKKPPMTRVAIMLAGVSGGVGGLLGVAGLPVELPVTTILMLRAIANIARHKGRTYRSWRLASRASKCSPSAQGKQRTRPPLATMHQERCLPGSRARP